MGIDYKKIADEDPEFSKFIDTVISRIVRESPDFVEMLVILYSQYQSGLTADQGADFLLMNMRLNKSQNKD